MSTSTIEKSGKRAAWLLLVPPALAVIGGLITLYLVWQYPDQALPIDPVESVSTQTGVRQHVVNSVTPPLK